MTSAVLKGVHQKRFTRHPISAVIQQNNEDNKDSSVPKRRVFGWLKRVPRIRYRRPENRCPDQLLELTVLNERLLGSSPWEVRRKVEYLKKRQENWDLVYEYIVKREAAATLMTIEEANRKVEIALSEQSKESKSVLELRKELTELQKEVKAAHEKLHFMQSSVSQNLNRIQKLKWQLETQQRVNEEYRDIQDVIAPRKLPNVEKDMLNDWYPVAFSNALKKEGTLISFELFGQPWVLFKDKMGNPACIRDECAHRACPLSIGKIVNGHVSCPYHGWEYDGSGSCVKMPSTIFIEGIRVDHLPAMEQDRFIWVWPSQNPPQKMPLLIGDPNEWTILSETEQITQIDQSLVLSNLLDDENSTFRHISSSWFKTDILQEHQRKLSVQSSFSLPCCVTSTMQIGQPFSEEHQKSIRQVFVCLPAKDGEVRILHQLLSNFWPWTTHLVFMRRLFEGMSKKILQTELLLAQGQQERMKKAGVHYNRS